MKLSNNTILITGGGSGIGLAFAEKFLELGNDVLICGRDQQKLDAAQAKHAGLKTFRCDLTHPGDTVAMGKKIKSDFPALNMLINNAGYAGDKPFGTLWFNAGRITRVTSRRLYYMIETYGGHSGSPVWRFHNNQRHAGGIHAYGGCPNKAARITREVFNNMMNWKNA